MKTTTAGPAGRLFSFSVFFGAVILFFINYYLAVQTPIGHMLEAKILDESEFTFIARFPLNLAKPVYIMSALAILSVYTWRKQGLFKALSLWFIAGTSMLAAQVAKYFLPREELLDTGASGVLLENSLPSGHMSIFATLIILLIITVATEWLKSYFWFGFLFFTVASWQLLHSGWHRPSDMIASVLLTVATVSLFRFFIPKAVTSHREANRNKLENKYAAIARKSLLSLSIAGMILFTIFVSINFILHGFYFSLLALLIIALIVMCGLLISVKLR